MIVFCDLSWLLRPAAYNPDAVHYMQVHREGGG